MRREKFTTSEYYHIYNRGVEKRKIFLGDFDYERFLFILRYLNSARPVVSIRDLKWSLPKSDVGRNSRHRTSGNEDLVEIICYCLNPNHYHLILKQKKDGGISKFMQKISNSYTKYFNNKNKRSGFLFQGPFKSVHINSNEHLLYLSVYVNCNNFIHGISKNIGDWKYSSYLDYVDRRNGTLCNKKIILSQFNDDFEAYKKFCDMNMNYLRSKKEMQKYLIEEVSW